MTDQSTLAIAVLREREAKRKDREVSAGFDAMLAL